MSGTDHEWHDLMEAWQSEAQGEAAPPPLSDEVRQRIRRKVRWHGYGLILLTICEVATAVGVTAWLIHVSDIRQPVGLFALLGTLVLFGVAFYFTLKNRRGTWRPAAESTVTFVDLSIKRCHRKLRTIRFIPRLLAMGMSFLAVWGTWALLSRPETPPLMKWIEFFGFVILYPVPYLAWGAWYKKRTLRELAKWEELRRSL
jgi:hypothetical protein